MLYVLIAIIALVAIYFLFLRKRAEPTEAPPRTEPSPGKSFVRCAVHIGAANAGTNRL